jgi:hypothetical protein
MLSTTFDFISHFEPINRESLVPILQEQHGRNHSQSKKAIAQTACIRNHKENL